jgi:sulfite exporter TauE/SafE
MTTESIVSAFIIGFLGSLHCVGMCGPLAMVVPLRGNKWLAILSYHFSRILVYSMLGFTFGLFGAQLTLLQSGQRVSLIVGIALILVFVLPYLLPKWKFANRLTSFSIGLFSNLSKPALQSKSFASVAVLGAINGLLPCGLIYVALAGAVSQDSPWNGALFMLLVGLGTFPATISIMAFRRLMDVRIRKLSKYAVPIIAGFLAVMLIVRGLNLDIPYVSPKIEKVSTSDSEICE